MNNIDLSKIQNMNFNDDDILASDDESTMGGGTRNKKTSSNQLDFNSMIDRPMGPSVDDIIYKQKLISKITQYHHLFFVLMNRNNISIDDLESKSIPELETLLYKIKEVVQNRNMLSSVKNASQFIPVIIEHVGKKHTPLKLDGYAKALNRDEEFEMQVNEILLEYDVIDNIKVNPINRLAYTMVKTALLVHQVNTMKETQMDNQIKQHPINETIKNKYSDI